MERQANLKIQVWTTSSSSFHKGATGSQKLSVWPTIGVNPHAKYHSNNTQQSMNAAAILQWKGKFRGNMLPPGPVSSVICHVMSTIENWMTRLNLCANSVIKAQIQV